MKQTDDMFYEISTSCEIVDEIKEFIFDGDPKQDWGIHWYWDHKWLPPDIFLTDPFLFRLAKKVRFKIGILRSDPSYCYDWHTDICRNCTINLLVNPEVDSRCMFSKEKIIKTRKAIEENLYIDDHPFVDGFSFHELKYKKNKFYLFNTKVEHAMINYDKKSQRYLASLEFQGEDAKLRYDEMLKIIKDIEKEIKEED